MELWNRPGRGTIKYQSESFLPADGRKEAKPGRKRTDIHCRE